MLKFFIILGVVFTMTSCSNAKLDTCKEKASKLWNNNKTATKADNKPYWNAIKRCEKKYNK